MNTALTYIAESVVKAVGVAGIEAMAMKKAITLVWNPIATEFADELLAAVIVGDQVRPERAENIMTSYRLRLTNDFVEEVAPQIEEFVGYAYDRGKEYILSDSISGVIDLSLVTKVKKDQESVVSALVSITGSTKKNVERTITRWFKETQGQYFDRFIVPETARLMSYAEQAEGNVTSLAKIGRDYKKFVEADAYWSSVSEFNAESSKVWAQVQTLHEIGVDTYTLIAVIDNKTCPVCLHLNGTSWSVQQAVNKIYDMLIMESEEAYERNPFPPRSTPKDYPDPQEAPFDLPPFHPRCRCNIRSEFQVTQMPGDVVARPFDHAKPPTDKGLTKVFNTYINKMSKKEVEAALKAGDKYIPSHARAMTVKEFKRVKEGFEDIPYEIRKWAQRNRDNYRVVISDAEDFTSRVYGNTIILSSRYVADDIGTHVIQHELRHALIHKPIMQVKGGGETIYNDIVNRTKKTAFRNPIHMNKQYAYNGGRGIVAAEAAGDEFLAMIGDYYSPGMSLEDLVKAVRAKNTGIEIATKAGQVKLPLPGKATYWTAKEAKQAVTYWWSTMDIDDLTLLSQKQLLAKLDHVPMSAAKMHIATQNELRLRDLLRKAGIAEVYQEGDRRPYDVWIGADPVTWYENLPGRKKPHTLIEVKSIIEAKNSKITMHTESLARKKTEWRKFGKRRTGAHTVVFDERTGKIYYKPGVGSYRLSAMEEVTAGRLQEIFGGKATETVVEAVEDKVKFMEITSKAQFNKFRANMELVKAEHRLFLDWYSWEEYKEKGIRLFMSQDGQTGMGLTRNRMGVTLWTRADATPGVGKKMIAHGIRQGMDNLECFDGRLREIYSEFGFKVTARHAWNEEFAPTGWNYKDWGKPDYLEMRLPKTMTQASRAAERLAEAEEIAIDATPTPWKWKKLPLKTSKLEARRAAVKFEQWMESNFQECWVEFAEGSKFSPRQKIHMINELAEELTRVQKKYPNMAYRWDSKHGLGVNRIVIHEGTDLSDITFDGYKNWGAQVLDNDGQGAAGLFVKNLETSDLDEVFTENTLFISVDTSKGQYLGGELRNAGPGKIMPMDRGELSLGTMFSITGDSMATFNHELGHAVLHSLEDDFFYKAYAKKWDKIFEQYGGKGSIRIDDAVSVYGSTNAHEMFAESFAAYIHPKYGTKGAAKLPRVIDNFFNDLMNEGKLLEGIDDIGDYTPPVYRKPHAKKRPTTKSSSINQVGSIDNGNVNEVQIVTIGDSDKRWIYKPIEGESFFRPVSIYDDTLGMFHAAKNEFHLATLPTHVDQLTDEMWDYLGDLHDAWRKEEWLVRYTIPLDSVSLAGREAFALEVAHDLGFNNEYAIVPEFTFAVDNKGKRTGILIEFIKDADVETAYFGREMWDEERFQMVVFDYLIGNTDRHENNWMRTFGVDRPSGRTLTTPSGEVVPVLEAVGEGKPVYIDHGYCMPGQSMDLGGISEFRAMQVGTGSGGREMYAQMEWDLDPDYLEGLITRLQRFTDDDELRTITKKYGFSREEVEAMEYRLESLVERLRGGTFSDLMIKHRDDHGLWGLEDSFIE